MNEVGASSTYDASPSTSKVLGGGQVSKVEITTGDGRWKLFGHAKVLEVHYEPDEEDIITKNWSNYGPRTVSMTLQMVSDATGVDYRLQDLFYGAKALKSKHFA